jgi:thioesterase domain-containing protein/malonyl CoA-acyl carrier protein transacylase/acyl carrier protein
LYPKEAEQEETTGQLMQQTAFTQPVLFTIEYALANLWMSWGVQPEAMIGHSIGEYVAACLADVFSLEDALFLVSFRGKLMQELPVGSMLAVALSESDISAYLEGGISLAAVNTDQMCVLSGEDETIERLEKSLSKQGILTRRLHTSHAFHSEMMTPIMESFAENVQKVTMKPPCIPYISNVSGDWVSAKDVADPYYWSNHLRNTVRFSKGISCLFQNTARVLLEVGPGNTLCTLARQQTEKPDGLVVLPSMRHPKEQKPDMEFIQTSLGKLWLAGVDVDWKSCYSMKRRLRVPLPTYPFQRKTYWPDPEAGSLSSNRPYPVLESRLESRHVALKEEEIYRAETSDDERNDFEGFAAPKGETEQKIAEMWKRLLGIDRISRTDDYFELGGSSMMAARLFADIEREFNKKLPLTTMLNAPTIEQLSRIVADENWSASWSPLVALQETGSNPPFFCMHGADGLVFVYRELARHLGKDQPFYGLQAQGLNGDMPFNTTIEDMASLYIKEIQAIQPEGPYYLGGYCMGGTIALEIAQQLHSQGQRIGLLAMLETYNWANLKKPSFFNKTHYYAQKVDFHLRNLFIADSRRAFLQEKVKVAKNRSKMWANGLQTMVFDKFSKGNGFSVSLAHLWETNDRAVANYIPKKYPGRITSIRPVKQYSCYENPALGWSDYAEEGMDVHILDVYPGGMLIEPFVRKLAAKLRDCIEKAT